MENSNFFFQNHPPEVFYEACNLIKKETLAQVFCSEFCKIFKNTFFTEHFRATVSVLCLIPELYLGPYQGKP